MPSTRFRRHVVRRHLPEDAPDASDAARDEAEDAARHRAEAAARAEGKYLPNVIDREDMRLVSTALGGAQVTMTRPGVMALAGVTAEQAAAALDPEHYEIAESGGHVWVRLRPEWVASPDYHGTPPF